MKRYAANPRYLELRGKPILAVGSGEHYGAVLNADFDYAPYLDEMARDGLNQCRIFSGVYREPPGEFGIADNTLAPRDEAFLHPWLPDPSRYWSRLKDFCVAAGKRGILVEYVLFCFWYNDALWALSPLHRPEIARRDVYSVANNPLLPAMERFVRKAVAELAGLDNVYIEVCNEPYSAHDGSDAAIDAWQRWVCDILRSADPTRLVAVNYQNRTGLIRSPHPAVGIANFHYAVPEAALSNWHLGLVLADDETGFAGQSAEPYRKEAWRFFLSGGAMVSHLDYSFTVAHPDGSASLAGTKTPGYGGKDLRRQLGYLRKTLEAAVVWELSPRNEALHGGDAQVLATADRSRVLVYLPRGGSVTMAIRGSYAGVWHDTVGCRVAHEETRAERTWTAPEGVAEALLTLERKA